MTAYPVVPFPDPLTRTDTATTTTGKGGGGGKPIATLGDRKIRCDGEYFYIPNTRQGQRLALLLTGNKERSASSWLTIPVGAVSEELDQLLGILSAMAESTNPALPPNYEENKRLLISLGGRGKPVDELARLKWVTPALINAWVANLTAHNRPNNLIAVLIGCLRSGDEPAGFRQQVSAASITKHAEVRLHDGRTGIVDSVSQDGRVWIILDGTAEIDKFDTDYLTVISE